MWARPLIVNWASYAESLYSFLSHGCPAFILERQRCCCEARVIWVSVRYRMFDLDACKPTPSSQLIKLGNFIKPGTLPRSQSSDIPLFLDLVLALEEVISYWFLEL